MHHVRVVAILMIVQGVLEFVASLGLAAMAVFMWQAVSQCHDAKTPGRQPSGCSLWSMAALRLPHWRLPCLHVVAGLRNWRFRGRTLGIVALAAGMVTVFTCYCLPTAMALGVYGLIVYLNGEVSDAFRMAEAGQSVDQIFATFRR